METLHQQPPQPMTQEAIKQAEFSATLRSILFRLRQEVPTISTFNFGNKEHRVDTLAAAVKAYGQAASSIAHDVYKEVVRH